MSATLTDTQGRVATEFLQRIAADLAMVTDRKLALDLTRVELANARPAGRGRVHISFKLGFRRGAHVLHGALLVPLPDAIALAGWLMMLPDDAVTANRRLTSLDSGTKGALLEIGNYVASACEAALRALSIADLDVRSEGCQGVRADVRPALVYTEGSELVVGRAGARLPDGEAFELILMIPAML